MATPAPETTTTTLRAYHNDPQLKADFVSQIEWHAQEDRITQGVYWEEPTKLGCAVGCSIESMARIKGVTLDEDSHANHALYEEYIGVPRVLAHLEDAIFEGLPLDRATVWPAVFAQAIPVGADLSQVWDLFAIRLLTDPEDGVIRYAEEGTAAHTAILAVDALYRRKVSGETIEAGEWEAAAYYAASQSSHTATYAAYAAAGAAKASDAAQAVSEAAEVGAYAARSPIEEGWNTAVEGAYEKQAVQLLDLLRAAPVTAPNGSENG